MEKALETIKKHIKDLERMVDVFSFYGCFSSAAECKKANKELNEAIAELEKSMKPKSLVLNALKEYLSLENNKDEAMVISKGKSYTANQLISEIENNSTIGKELEQDVIVLTIDLLFRGKESLSHKECDLCAHLLSKSSICMKRVQLNDGNLPKYFYCSEYKPKDT